MDAGASGSRPSSRRVWASSSTLGWTGASVGWFPGFRFNRRGERVDRQGATPITVFAGSELVDIANRAITVSIGKLRKG